MAPCSPCLLQHWHMRLLGHCTGAASSVLTPGGEAWLQTGDQEPRAMTEATSGGIVWGLAPVSPQRSIVEERELPTPAFDNIDATL